MKSTCVIALDAGSGSGRTAVFDLEGHLLGIAAESWSPHVPEDEPLGSEFDPQETWSALARTTRRAMKGAGMAAQSVRAISATSQRDGVVFLDAKGQEVYCGTNRDARGVLHAEDIARTFGEAIHRVTGRWPLGLSAMARLWWFRSHRPEVYRRIAHLLMVSDWLTYRLCGNLSSEPTNASSSMLFDVVQHAWSSELAALLAYPPQLGPPCHEPGHVVGTLTRSAADVFGLAEGIPVVIGAGDSQAACLGCAAFDDGTTTIIAGTTIPVQMILSHPVCDESHRLHLGAYVTPDRWVLESNGGMAGTSYDWFCRTFVSKGAPAYVALEREMQDAEPGEVLAVLGPQIADFRELSFPPKSTFVFPFLGGAEHLPTRAAFARAILENIAYAARGNVTQLEEISGQEVTSLNLCGGLARSNVFAQIIADVGQRPVRVPSVRETSCLGAAICAAVGAGVYPDLSAAARTMVHWEPVVQPDPANVRRYRGLYRKWIKLFEKARGL